MTIELDRAIDGVVCNASVGTGLREVVLVPDGDVESKSGSFLLDAQGAEAILAEFDKHSTPLPIDFEHQTLGGVYSAPNGRAPAAGWIRKLFYEAGRGLVGLVEWNGDGATAIRSKQYLFLSPVIAVRKSDRRAVALHSAALTNKPAIPRMEALAASERFSQELMAMADEPRERPAPNEGEVRAALEELREVLGAPQGTPPLDLLKKSVEWLKQVKEEDAERETAEPNSEVAVFTERIAELEAQAQERDVKDRLRPFVDSGILNPDRDKAFYEQVVSLVRADADATLAALQRMNNLYKAALPMQGRIPGPSAETLKRNEVISGARSEFIANSLAGKLTTARAFIDDALRQADLSTLSDEEVRQLAIV